MKARNLPPIFLVEDSPEDHIAIMRALEQSGLEHPVLHFVDGGAAIEHLRDRGAFVGREGNALPCLIVLDLNLPGLDGLEVLRAIKSDHELRSIPVVIFSTSCDPRDVGRCYDAGANSYVVKPSNFCEFVEAIATIHRYWTLIALQSQPAPARQGEHVSL